MIIMRDFKGNNINVFILAAGFGERLLPITNYIPKPLMPVIGLPIIERVMQKVAGINAVSIGINLHYKSEDIYNYLKHSPYIKRIRLFFEDSILGTGGALKNAEHFLKAGHFLVYNSDILSNIDLDRLIEFHLSSNNLATLAIHDYPEHNKLEISENGLLIRVSSSENHSASAMFAFTGIAVYSPDFLNFLPKGRCSVVEGWLNTISAGLNIGTLRFDDHSWNDIGSPSGYASAVIKHLRAEGETIYIHPSINEKKNIKFKGHLIIENDCILENNNYFKNCILLPGSHPNPEVEYENCIIGKEFLIPLEESVFLGSSKNVNTVCIGQGGSDRKYFRVKRDGEPVVLMQTGRNDPDFCRQIEITEFFYGLNIPVPRLLEVDYKNFNAVFEDLGDISLYSWLKFPRNKKDIVAVYKKVLDCLLLIHIEATRHLIECPSLNDRIFNYDHLRWESNYFMESFVRGIRDIEINNQDALNIEFHRIAQKTDSFKKTVIHRDFQSQNIMITDNNTPRIIDYQGARIGTPAYDIASVLWDPYYRLDDDLRDGLLAYYTTKLSVKACFLSDEFSDALIFCRLQRHMQALGAYGFLSKVKGKKYFLKHIPEGLQLLKEDAFILKYEYPELYNLTVML